MIAVEVGAMSDKDLEEAVDEDLAAFEQFMLTRVDPSGPLSKPERAIIKTYLYWKTHPEVTRG